MNKQSFKVNYKILQTYSVAVNGELVKVNTRAALLYCHMSELYNGYPLDYQQKDYAQHLGLGVQVIGRELALLEQIGAISRSPASYCGHVITVNAFPAPYEAPALVDEQTHDDIKENAVEAVQKPQAVELMSVSLAEPETPVEAPAIDSDLMLDTSAYTFFDVVDYIADNCFYKWSGESVTEFAKRMLTELDKDPTDAPKLVRYIKESKPEVFEELNAPF